MTAAASTVERAISEHLGCMVWWDLSSVRVTPSDLRAVLAAEGDPAQVPDIDQPAAARRAIRAWTKGRGHADRYRAEVVYDEGGYLVAGVLRREQAAEKEARWTQVGRIEYQINGDGIDLVTVDPGPSGEHEAEVREVNVAVADACHYLDHDFVRPWLQGRLDSMSSFRLRRAGGVEFVPHVYREQVERLARVVRRIGRSSFEVADVAATASSQASVGTAARETLVSQLADIDARLDAWQESARSVSDRSYTSVMEAFGDLALRAELYQSMLEVGMSDLSEKLNAAKARARKLIEEGA